MNDEILIFRQLQYATFVFCLKFQFLKGEKKFSRLSFQLPRTRLLIISSRTFWYSETNTWDFLRFFLSAYQHPFDSLLQLLLHIPTVGSRRRE